jgi:hypothetical protein
METVRRFTLSNQNGMSVEIINYGATITSLHVPDRTGNVEDIVLGFDNVEGKWLCSYYGMVCLKLSSCVEQVSSTVMLSRSSDMPLFALSSKVEETSKNIKQILLVLYSIFES